MIVIVTLMATWVGGELGVGTAEAGPVGTSLGDALPTQISADYLLERRFVDFGSDDFQGLSQRAPLASRLSYDGSPVSTFDRRKQRGVFTEHFLATLPAGQPIRIGKDAHDHEAWFYPTGTEIAHVVTFRGTSAGESGLLELRLVQKLADGRWAFGLYTPDADARSLRLNRQGDPSVPASRDFTALDAEDIPVRIAFTRIHTESCLGCHAALTPSRAQFATVDEVGPCGFVAANPQLRSTWADRYLRERGEPAFASGNALGVPLR